MSIYVENTLQKTNKEAFEQRAHYVPCKVEEDGPANVKKYFEPYIVEENGELTASFRGHPLDGTKMSFPEGYRAVVVTETKRPLSEDADRKFHVAGGFKDFVYWNWDKKPSKNDNMVKAMDWIDIAEAAITSTYECQKNLPPVRKNLLRRIRQGTQRVAWGLTNVTGRKYGDCNRCIALGRVCLFKDCLLHHLCL